MHSQQPPGVVQNRSTLQCSKQNTEQCGWSGREWEKDRERERERERERPAQQGLETNRHCGRVVGAS